MRLTLQTDLALRLLMHLGVSEDRLITISDFSKIHDVSKNHMMKVSHQMVQMGFVESVRGRAGGLRLAKSSADINLGDVVRQMESNTAIVACFPGGSGACRISPSCRLKGVLAEALEGFFAVLDRYTLADLTQDRAQLTSLLNITD